MFHTKRFILVDTRDSKIVFGDNNLDTVVDKANYFTLHGSGSSYQVFTNLLQVSNTKIPTLKTFGELV